MAIVSAVCAALVLVPISSSPAGASTDRLRITFDVDGDVGTVLVDDAPIADSSGAVNHGRVLTRFGGAVAVAADTVGAAADFPGPCTTEPCPNAMVVVADHPSLDPGLADFEWGARLLLQPTETADGENVLQKGRFGENGGQWKLQVDKSAGVPSCVVSGKVPGSTTERLVVLLASIGIADGAWHQVTCRRTAAAGVQIVIDGVVRGSAWMPVVRLDNVADLTVGAKSVDTADNDQFHGVLDDAFMTVLDDTPIPNGAPVASFTSSCVDLTCAFDASGSLDDGAITYSWDFGDGSGETGAGPVHTFSALGDQVVSLTVTDRSGLVNTIVQTVSLAENTPPVAAFDATCVDLGCTFDAAASTDDGAIAYSWSFGDGATASTVAPTYSFGGAGDQQVTLTVTDVQGLSDSVTNTVTTVQPVPKVTFVGQASASASTATQTVRVPSGVRAGDLLLMFLSNANNPTVKAPTGVTGWVQVDTLTASKGATRVWRKVATAGDAGAQVKIGLSAATKANITIVAYRGTSATKPVASFSRSLLTTSSATRTTPLVTVGVPSVVVSYWMHHDSTTTALVPPAGVVVRASGTQSGTGHVSVLTADSGASVAAGSYGGLTAKAAVASGLGTAWTIVLAPA